MVQRRALAGGAAGAEQRINLSARPRARLKRAAAQEQAGKARDDGARQEQHFYVPNSVAPGNLATPSWLTTELGLALPADYDGSAEGRRLTLVLEDAQGGVLRRAQVSLAQLEAMAGFAASSEPVAWHCVTGRSKTGLRFHGVPLRDVLALLQLGEQEAAGWTHLVQVAADGYMTLVFRQDALAPGCLLATREGGAPIPAPHGGPRLLLPHLWGWKSAKHLTELRLARAFRPGFCERLSCHERGRIYDADTGLLVDERWQAGLGALSDFLTGAANAWHHVLGPRAYAWVMRVGGKFAGVGGQRLLQKPKLM